ncbi:MAG: alkaline shock response membrane anchor protein AmaP [Candidatus Omnitrophica bacterium]|nr:alkaline shock response membrane anchor protein AmaP [Candidatus Omnitrophota bacterium]MBD3268661.1 alkaline shock response membrane anchor protein AmaP [Candidatus Omnitrophota bacterium]
MGFLTVLIYVIISLIGGSLLIGLSLGFFDLAALSAYAETVLLGDFYARFSIFLIGMLLILFCLRYLQAVLARSRKNKSVTFESPEGKVSVSLSAMEDMIKKMLEENPEISHIKPKVFLKKKKIEIKIRGILNSEVNLVNFTKEIQERIKEKINILLGEDKQVQINLEIRKVALGEQKGTVEDTEPEIPFRHYE